MGIVTRRETRDGVERLHFARTLPGWGPVYWGSSYRTGRVLVDSGIARARREFTRFLDERPVDAVLATHEHEDHVGNHAVLAARGVPAYAPRATVDLLRRIAEGRATRLPMYRAVAWGHHEGVARGVTSASGVVKAGDKSFRLVPTPGHSAEHVALLDEATGDLFTGDAVLGKLKVSRAVEDVPLQMESLRQVLAIDPRVVYPAHGPVLERPREQVAAVLDYLEDLQRRAHALATKGWRPRRIARELLGREDLMTWFSAKEFSRENLVRSLLSRPPR